MPGPGGILALDLAGITGWCLGDPEAEIPLFGTWKLRFEISWGAGFASLENELEDALALHRPREVAMEAALDKAMQATARGKRNESAAYQQFALAGLVEATCYRHSIGVVIVHCNQARAAVIGQGIIPKEKAKATVMQYCRWRGWNPPDHNAGDAGIIWQYRAAILKQIGRIAA